VIVNSSLHELHDDPLVLTDHGCGGDDDVLCFPPVLPPPAAEEGRR
jgi:hypothetical protein